MKLSITRNAEPDSNSGGLDLPPNPHYTLATGAGHVLDGRVTVWERMSWDSAMMGPTTIAARSEGWLHGGSLPRQASLILSHTDQPRAAVRYQELQGMATDFTVISYLRNVGVRANLQDLSLQQSWSDDASKIPLVKRTDFDVHLASKLAAFQEIKICLFEASDMSSVEPLATLFVALIGKVAVPALPSESSGYESLWRKRKQLQR